MFAGLVVVAVLYLLTLLVFAWVNDTSEERAARKETAARAARPRPWCQIRARSPEQKARARLAREARD